MDELGARRRALTSEQELGHQREHQDHARADDDRPQRHHGSSRSGSSDDASGMRAVAADESALSTSPRSVFGRSAPPAVVGVSGTEAGAVSSFLGLALSVPSADL
jgi:hypothetical protein